MTKIEADDVLKNAATSTHALMIWLAISCQLFNSANQYSTWSVECS